jgi:hypothetical protein
MKKNYFFLMLAFLAILANGCESLFPTEEDDTDPSNSALYEGTWVRLLGPSGDRTDLAIGGIAGEPENRVYMCELRGSTAAGFYKGMLNGNVITWDSQYGLPDTYLSMVDGQLEFDYRCCGTVPTYYERGSWSGECGPLSNSGGDGYDDGGNTGGSDSNGQATFWIQSDLGCGSITVNISGYGSATISSYYTSTPDCGSSGTATFTLPAGTYGFTASCTDLNWEGTVTVSEGGCYTMQLYN